MTNLTAQDQIAAEIAKLDCVSRVSLHEATGRHYITLTQGGGNADRNTKAYLKGSTLTVEIGKGYGSTPFAAARDALEAWCAERGTVSKLYSYATSFTASL